MSNLPAPNPEHVSATQLALQAELTELEQQAARMFAEVGLGTLSASGAASRVASLMRKAYDLGRRAEWNRAHEVRPPIVGETPFSASGP